MEPNSLRAILSDILHSNENTARIVLPFDSLIWDIDLKNCDPKVHQKYSEVLQSGNSENVITIIYVDRIFGNRLHLTILFYSLI